MEREKMCKLDVRKEERKSKCKTILGSSLKPCLSYGKCKLVSSITHVKELIIEIYVLKVVHLTS